MAYRVELIRSWIHPLGRKYPVGQIIQCDRELHDKLHEDGYAKDYTGKYPPVGKSKTDFFKPKIEK